MRTKVSILLFDLALSFIAITALASLAQGLLDLSTPFPLKVMLIFGVVTVLIALLAGKYLASRSFGPANRVTLVRAALTALLFGLIGEKANGAVAWFAVITAWLVLVLDGVDGWLARRHGVASDFGSRFDMETDALFIFVIAALTWQLGKTGPWVLAAGLMRYVFVASSYCLPWLRRPLPFSRRRKTIFVVQAISLIASLSPAFPNPVSDGVALAGLVLLFGSFAIDVVWLARTRQYEPLLSESDHLTIGYRRE